MPKIDINNIEPRRGSGYPPPLDAICRGRSKRALAAAGGLSQFGVNLTTLPPGQATAQRHWHTGEDEFVYVLEGEAVLIDDAGETPMGPGEAAAFPAGDNNGHHLVNRSDAPVLLLEVGARAARDAAHYPDVDLYAEKRSGAYVFTRKDGTSL